MCPAIYIFYHYLRQNQKQNCKIITQETIKPCVPVKVKNKSLGKVLFLCVVFFYLFFFSFFFLFFFHFFIDSKYILFS